MGALENQKTAWTTLQFCKKAQNNQLLVCFFFLVGVDFKFYSFIHSPQANLLPAGRRKTQPTEQNPSQGALPSLGPISKPHSGPYKVDRLEL